MEFPRQLRPLIERSIAVATEGERSKPPVPAPASIRRFTRFSKLPGAALSATRACLDADEEFRARVRASTSRDDVGEAGWLFLERPEGWEAKFDELLAESKGGAGPSPSKMQKRLAAAEKAAERSAAAALKAEKTAAEAADELAEERRLRRATSDEAGEVKAKMEALRAERDRAVGELTSARRQVADLGARSKAAEHDLAEATKVVEALNARAAAAEARAAALDAEAIEVQAFTAGPAVEPASAQASVVAAGLASIDPIELVALVADASAASSEMARSLGRIAGLLADGIGLGAERTEPEDDERCEAIEAPSGNGPSRRRLIPVPGGLLADSPVAAAQIVRSADVILLDGYNVSMTVWPELDIADQRHRLVRGLGEIASRAGTSFDVVFDGVDADGPGVSGRRVVGSGVRVRFTETAEIADDVLIELIDGYPVDDRLVLVTSDRELSGRALRRMVRPVPSAAFAEAFGLRPG